MRLLRLDLQLIGLLLLPHDGSLQQRNLLLQGRHLLAPASQGKIILEPRIENGNGRQARTTWREGVGAETSIGYGKRRVEQSWVLNGQGQG